jgi:hypothetical protein
VITAQTPLVDVAFEVCTALDVAGYVAVLTGGSAATYYVPSQYLFWNDFSALKQALLIQSAHPDRVDLDLIRSWCERERQLPKYHLFIERIQSHP